MAGPPLRIAHLDTERTWRGGQNQVLSLINGLAARDHFNLAVLRRKSALAERLAHADCQIFEVTAVGEWDLVSAMKLRSKLFAEKIEIVHAHSGHAVALAAFATIGTKIPFVLTRRVDFPLKSNFLSRWKYDRAARIIAISSGVGRVLITGGIPENKIAVVPSGIDFQKFEGVQRRSRADLLIPGDAFIVGQVAALAPHKDQVTLIQAAALLIRKHPDVHLVLVGEGECRRDLEERARRLAISSHTHFLGFQPRPLDILSMFDAFCFTSKEEGLGTSIMDAMALGVPVVATRTGGIPDLIDDGETGLLTPIQNPVETCNALERVLRDSTLRDKIVRGAKQKVVHFDVKRTIGETEQIYWDVLSLSSPSSD